MEDKIFYLVLGMHRSGTSCLAGSLERCGLYLGNVSRKGRFNKKGNHENKIIYQIHDQILALNKSSWHHPPSNEIIVHDYYSQKIEEIIAPLRKEKRAGSKDPRTLLLIGFWKKLLIDDYQLIGTFRHPLAVAQSLFKRDKIPIEKGLELWCIYNKLLIEEHQKSTFPLIHYNLNDKKKYIKNIQELTEKHQLKFNYFKVKRFVSSALENNQYNYNSVPIECLSTYQYLLDHAIR